jgi:alkanesulfonate monooxygenase SsuD/methylene tetrahydromethanopterin reductase-like flavin-dependent oxidoreductase (luciferase family)
MNTTSFELTLPQRGVLFGIGTLPDLIALACEAESGGLFDSIWVGDSLFAKPRPDSLTLLGGLATATQRVRLGVGCMASFPVRDPIVFAYQWGTLDLLSQGRMLLAACTGIVAGGASAHEGAHWGVTDRERAARLEENMQICRRLWSEEKVSFRGAFHSFEDVTVQPRPVQQPCPIWIASNPRPIPGKSHLWQRALRRVARLADGWMTVQMAPNMLASNWETICTLLQEEGRDPATFPNMAYHNINLQADRQAALEESKRFLDAYYGPVFSPPMVESWTAAGTPQQCIEHLQALVRDGARSITLRLTSWHQTEQYKRLVHEVLPYV